ncbi:sigma-70 family RNA polymerase sigma factor [Flavonifractor plautii]|nr:sigma-70 family RNA polymerase sigma factor [Flavonifractor plautii]
MEPRTLEELYRRYAGELYLYAYSLCQNEAQAQDLTAEAFCRALLALDGADAGWRSWLYKVCRNLWLDQVRRSRRLSPGAARPGAGGGGRRAGGAAPGGTAPGRLPGGAGPLPGGSEIVTLHYYGGLSLKEAGEAMGLTPGAARTLLCRARKKLKSRLEGQI